MLENPMKFAADLCAWAVTGFGMLTLNQWAGLLGICWWAYRFADEFYQKWQRSKSGDQPRDPSLK